MYKTLGGYNWSDLFKTSYLLNETIYETTTDIIQPIDPFESVAILEDNISNTDQSILETAQDMQSSLDGLKAVNINYYHRIAKTMSFSVLYLMYVGVYDGSLSRSFWFCNMVDMFCMVCCIFIGNALSIIFY